MLPYHTLKQSNPARTILFCLLFTFLFIFFTNLFPVPLLSTSLLRIFIYPIFAIIFLNLPYYLIQELI